MIKLQSRGGREHIIVPVFVCDVCGEAITDVSSGAVVFRGFGVGEDELLHLMHVHKGPCHDRADVMLCGTERAAWDELEVHVNEIVASVGIRLRDTSG